jgi:hypothetical protein
MKAGGTRLAVVPPALGYGVSSSRALYCLCRRADGSAAPLGRCGCVWDAEPLCVPQARIDWPLLLHAARQPPNPPAGSLLPLTPPFQRPQRPPCQAKATQPRGIDAPIPGNADLYYEVGAVRRPAARRTERPAPAPASASARSRPGPRCARPPGLAAPSVLRPRTLRATPNPP